MTSLIVYLVLTKQRPAVYPVSSAPACSNPIKCDVRRGVVIDRRDRPKR